jgi:tagaturonate reductase
LVDRIVPGSAPAAQIESFSQEIGYQDALLIIAEPYCLWAIEGDERVSNILTFQKAMPEVVVIEPDITRYRERKLRLLNGTHTLICGLAHLAGFFSVEKAMSDADFSKFVEKLMQTEIAPNIPAILLPGEAESFGQQVMDRLRNPFIEHRWLSIAMQYSSKMKTRIVPLLIEHYQKHKVSPQGMALGLAAFLVFYREGLTFATDDAANHFFEKWQHQQPIKLVHDSLSDIDRWGADLSLLPGFEETVYVWVEQILEQGAKATLHSYIVKI